MVIDVGDSIQYVSRLLNPFATWDVGSTHNLVLPFAIKGVGVLHTTQRKKVTPL